jgi:outer membrane protein TolC
VQELLQDPSGSGGGDTVGQTFTQLSRTTAGLNIRQTLFKGLQEYMGIKIAGYNRARAKLEKLETERLLLGDVATAFYTIATIEREIQTDQMIIKVVRDRIRDLKKRIDLGKSREGELTQEESALALLLANLERREGDKKIAYEMMSFLTGLEPMPPIRWSDPIQGKREGVDYFLAQAPRRPDLQAAVQTVKIAEGEIGVARGNFLPGLDAEANIYAVRPGFQSDIRWDLTFNLDVPVFNWSNFGIYQESKLRAQQARLGEQNLGRIADNQIREVYEDFQSSLRQYKKFSEAVLLAKKNFDLQNKDFNLGLADNLDVLTAQRTWLEALQEQNRTEVQTWSAWLNLQIVSGILP